MRFPIVIEPGDREHAYGVVVPGLPGCFSAGDTLDEAIANASDAILLHVEGLLDAGQPLPELGNLESFRDNPDFAGWIWAIAEVDLSRLEEKAQRVNITLPRRLLTRIDRYAASHHETRSALLARAAIKVMQEQR